jgi:ferrous iron transport protein B
VRSLSLRLVDRGKVFLRQAGTVILAVTIVLWVLSHIPFHTDLTTSVIGRLGHLIEPAIRPLGFNWKIGIGLLTSVLAREVIVGTLGTLYGADPATQSLGLQAALRHDLTLAAGDEQLAVAGGAVCLHERAGVCGGAGDQPGDSALCAIAEKRLAK